MSTLPYSYHTFLFPFIWNDGGTTSWDDFKKVLSIGKRWVAADWGADQIPLTRKESEWLLDYAAYQYFTEPANNALFNTRGDNVVHCFEYWNGDKAATDDGNYKYVITKGDRTYNLLINKIRLYVYDAGVAVLIFELENRDYKNLDAVNSINEYGRRINLPYLSPGYSHTLCADKIELLFNDKVFSCENYLQTLVDLKTDFKAERMHISLNYIMKPIQTLLDGGGADNGGYEVTSNSGHRSRHKPFIKPCIDDRMFVCCLVVDDRLSDELKGVGKTDYSFIDGWSERLGVSGGKIVDADGKEHSDYMQGWADETFLANRVYKYLFVENDVSCQNTHMKKELLCDSVYRRWVDTGTLFGATHHSFCCIANSGVLNTVINPFLTQYVKLAILIVVQRAVILSLSNESATVSEGFRDDVDISPQQIVKIEKLQAKYVRVQNQLLLTETTAQEQGVELYDLLCRHMYIEKNKKALDEQMNNLRDIADISNARLERKADNSLNRNLTFLTLIGLALALIQDLPILYDCKASWCFKLLNFIGVLILFVAAVSGLKGTLINKNGRLRKLFWRGYRNENETR
jgi:hypothetical protein